MWSCSVGAAIGSKLDVWLLLCSTQAINESANRTPRLEPSFFLQPASAIQRRYEALRAFTVEQLSLAEAAARFGYSPHSMASLVRDFRRGQQEFFLQPRPGPRTAPAKQAARPRILELRRAGCSLDEIGSALRAAGTALNRTGIAEVIQEAGLPRIWRRSAAGQGTPHREVLVRAQPIDFATFPAELSSGLAGLFLVIPELLELDFPALVAQAGYPGTRMIPALSYLLSLLALKLTAIRRVSHVDDIASDRAAGLFAGLTAIPKTTALSTYSYRTQHDLQTRLLAALGPVLIKAGLGGGTEFDLDFHAIRHFGQDQVLEEHYVPRRSQRTASMLTFFAQDAQSHNLVYANADLLKADQHQAVLLFCDHWQSATGSLPARLVFDGKLTTQRVLGQLDQRGVRFLTLRARSPKLLRSLQDLSAESWRSLQLERAGGYRKVTVADSEVQLSDYPGQIRQLAIRGLGHEHPTVLITNDRATRSKQLIERYANRMTIEQRLAESIRAFHLDALSSAVPLNVDLDVALTVLASTVCASFRRRLRGYESVTPDILQRRFFSTAGKISIDERSVRVRIDLRTFSPVLRQASLPEVSVPWWGERRLLFEMA